MKYIKKYESRPEAIDDGEYVIVKSNNPRSYIKKEWQDFIKNNVGKIKSHYYIEDHLIYIIDFNSGIDDGYRRFDHEKILAHSKNKEELEIILTANKYNL